MYVGYLLVRFHMTDYKLVDTPFIFGIKLEDGGDTPLVDYTKYILLVWSLLYLTLLSIYLVFSGSIF